MKYGMRNVFPVLMRFHSVASLSFFVRSKVFGFALSSRAELFIFAFVFLAEQASGFLFSARERKTSFLRFS